MRRWNIRDNLPLDRRILGFIGSIQRCKYLFWVGENVATQQMLLVFHPYQGHKVMGNTLELLSLIYEITKPNIEVSGWPYQTKIHSSQLVYLLFGQDMIQLGCKSTFPLTIHENPINMSDFLGPSQVVFKQRCCFYSGCGHFAWDVD